MFTRRTKSLNLRTLSDISLSERSDGSGTITFGPTSLWGVFNTTGSWPEPGRYAPPAFEMIEHAREAYELIREAQKTAT